MDIDSLLQPVTADQPSGPDCDNFDDHSDLYDELASLETSLVGEIKDGVTQPPRWPAIQAEAMKLAEKTKHLRIAAILTESACINEGYAGLRDGLKIIHAWCESFWDSLYPREERANYVESLSHPAFLVKPRNVIIASYQGSNYSIADFERSKEVRPDNEDQDAVNEARLIQGVFQSSSRQTHLENLEIVQEALGLARAIEDVFEGHGDSVSLADLREHLSKVSDILRPLSEEDTQEEGDAAGVDFSQGAGEGGGRHAKGVNSRQAAHEMLDKVALFFEQSEPASPVPLLIRRAQACIGKSFMDLLDELAIDRSQAEVVLKPAQEAEE